MRGFGILMLLVALLSLFACQQESEPVESAPKATEVAKEPEVESAPALTRGEALAAAIASAPGRTPEDSARDADRQPVEVLDFLGLEPGMTVLDVFAAGGWYSEVLAAGVGADGKVLIQNPPRLLAMRDGANEQALSARLAGGRLSNVERINQNTNEMGLANASVDMAFTALNFHDMVYLMSPEQAVGALKDIHAVLKPGGVLGIVDHYGAPDGNNAELHRIDPQMVRDMAVQAGFVVEAESGVLHHHGDDMTKMVFDPQVRGKTHRFVLRLRKT